MVGEETLTNIDDVNSDRNRNHVNEIPIVSLTP